MIIQTNRTVERWLDNPCLMQTQSDYNQYKHRRALLKVIEMKGGRRIHIERREDTRSIVKI